MSNAWRDNPSLQRIRAEWNASGRLRAGAAVAAAIIAVYLFLVLVDWRRGLHLVYQQESVRLYKTAALEGQDVWLVRAQQARDLRKALEAQVPQSGTLGLAQAEAQGWVQQLLRASGRDLTSQARAPLQVDAAKGLWKVPISVRGSMTPGQYVEVLRRVESNERLMVIEQASIDNQRKPVVDITISAYYLVKAAPSAGGGADASP